ncbi:hypothetical protein LCER1_G004142 [Lachnellula cervina]|uniref:Uncharacterized protein n=1 Tax=Lachnellula cervina TaxID=1316786 RepID=A0A7D8YLV9_9HELO|nr:hypothetical protein LCER1_G004142 [Lachnellula cervina]
MSAGFGFSVGDVLKAIELVSTVIDALRSSGRAGAEYRELVSQLLSLETALFQVKNFEFEESQYAEVVALRQASIQCRRTIDAFWNKAKKYQPHLGVSGDARATGVKDGWMRIKWKICKKDDVSRFKADLIGHTQSMLLLLATIQRSTSKVHEQRQDIRQRTIAARFQEGRINIKVFQIVLQIQEIINRVPAQIERQQPVYLIDTLGKESPFHLEFALISVLKLNFKKFGSAPRKIDRGEFAMQDSITKRNIDINRDWEVCFHPEQHINMSLVFSTDEYGGKIFGCPRCYKIAEAEAKAHTGYVILDLFIKWFV